MYVVASRAGMGGFWGSLVHGSVKLFTATVPIAAAGATGGASAALLAAGQEGAGLAAGKGKAKVQVQPSGASSNGTQASGNFLENLSSTELALLGVGSLALVVALGRR